MPARTPQPSAPTRRYVSMATVAQMFELSPRTVRAWVAEGRLTGYTVGSARTVRLDLAEVERVLAVRIPTAVPRARKGR